MSSSSHCHGGPEVHRGGVRLSPNLSRPSRESLFKRTLGLYLSAFAILTLPLTAVDMAGAKTFDWREEVALQDGGMIVLSWWVSLVPGQPFKSMVGEQRLKFTHPVTGQTVVWVDLGKSGSRLKPILLDVDDSRFYLVGLPGSGPDYDGFGCPTPPYIVLRYDAGAWVRVPLSELPMRFSKANLVGYGAEDLIRESNGYVKATQVEAWLDRVRGRADTEYMGRIDRRIRNPLGLGCIRPERTYGPGAYKRLRGSGNWLDKTEAEATKLLWGDAEGTKP